MFNFTLRKNILLGVLIILFYGKDGVRQSTLLP
jgi:hypothetical protein